MDHLLAEPRYLEATERTLKAAWAHIRETPHAHASLLEALDEHLQPQMVIVRGSETPLGDWKETLLETHLPGCLVLAIASDAKVLEEALENYRPSGKVTAWACKGTACSEPATTLDHVRKLIGQP